VHDPSRVAEPKDAQEAEEAEGRGHDPARVKVTARRVVCKSQAGIPTTHSSVEPDVS
jgi:hypothetical protein